MIHCHIPTPPELEQAEIEAEPATTEWCCDEELEVGSVEKSEKEEKGLDKQERSEEHTSELQSQ